ncbi:hypothetical protein WJM97_22205 [Okeanomitos corallinicola TIOX110]|uniref:Uncharacterized protein n=1 Tax=Okeanomitos corallinicola TIOX110 TaxID=3133117 RepID=A0ABZ2UV27_9CYAN
MGLIDGLLITVINAVICLGLPKLLSILLSLRTKSPKPSLKNSALNTEKLEISSFPYCTVYDLTGNQFCKFRPQFCHRCSSGG